MQDKSNRNPSLSESVAGELNINTARCYQCGKCSAGCPVAADMDYPSSVVMRMLQAEDGQTDMELLRSEAIWLCASCEMCLSRCPMQINIPGIMDHLRQRAVGLGVQNRKANRNIIPFHRSFLDMIKLTGRSYELGLVADYKMRSKKLMQDVALAPKMFGKGKLSITPEPVKGRDQIRRIFKKSKQSR